jgi:CubicO group peptidase (beta-lactamase class C family)
MEAIPVYAQPSVGISSSVQPFVDRHEVAGAVMLVADKDEILTLEATGWADIANNKKMQPDSMFWIASQSKPITSAAFMMLVDEGKVKLDDPVEKYLPEFKGQMVVAEQDNEHIVLHKPQHPFTIREALSHRSGLPFKSLVEEPTLDIYPLEARVRSYAMTNLQYEPGTDYLYSNAGINTVARIIEVITKMPYEQFLDERLIQPLGMKDTTFWPNEEQAARIAKAYKPGKDNMGLDETKIVQLYYPLTDHTHRTPMPGGGLFSTAHDVSRFYRMMLNKGELDGKRYLSEDAVKELTSRQTPETMKNSYGLGFTVNKTTFGHGGAYSTGTNADTASDLITIWLVQHAAFPGEGVKAQGTFQNAAKNKFAAVQAK